MTAAPAGGGLGGYPNFPNKAHQRAYENGIQARVAGKDRFPPYGCGSNSERYFRKAWLAGFDGADTRSALAKVSNGDAP